MAGVESFEDLRIWQDAKALSLQVYRDFGRGSKNRDFGFRDQICRAAVSVMNNIAEGFERSSDADFARFLRIAKGSCAEVRSMYYLAQELSYISEDRAGDCREGARQLSRGIAALIAHLSGGR